MIDMDSLLKAIDICGSQAALAKRITEKLPDSEVVTPQQVWNWLYRDKSVPERYCSAIEEVCDYKVTRRDLRPNDCEVIWPDLAKAGRRRITDKKSP